MSTKENPRVGGAGVQGFESSDDEGSKSNPKSPKRKALAARILADDTARAALDAINPDDSDQNIAAIIADWLTAGTHQPPYLLGIFHDVRPSAVRRVERARKYYPDYQPDNPTGPSPVEYDWQFKNNIGIRTLDSERARSWAIDALLLGYMVVRCVRSIRGSGSCMSIKHARERARKRGAT